MMNNIRVAGLGAGDLNQLPFGIYKLLKETDDLFLRTKEHPVIKQLEKEGISCQSFDDIYEKHDQFEAVYEEITELLLEEASKRDIVYAVPGHPLIAEKTVQLLLDRSDARGINVTVEGGQSFLDALFTAVRVDPIDGFQLLDGTMMKREDIQISQHVIIAQVYSQMVASDVKLTLMEKYPDDYEITVVTAAGSSDEKTRTIPLFELDRQPFLDNLTSVYVPPVTSRELSLKEFSTLRGIIADLRGPEGCPWDKKQTHFSLKKYLIEESYELLDAIDRDDIDDMIEELGDVLLQIMLHAQIGEDDGMFSIEDVLQGISEKMIRRHPHVFGETKAENADEVVANWEQIKAEEKGKPINSGSLLDQIEKGLPALLRAYEVQKAAAKVGFDWGNAAEAMEKVKEETKEFEEELAKVEKKSQLEEMGDLLFAVVNVARLAKIHPEEALQAANEKFYRRFAFIEEKVKESGLPFADFSLEELDKYWNEAKKQGK
ncbi:nucleoside triphosphate pyrophosphohydrolase [Siminovitchia fortis]|uniref:nucleoside triphosphate pyrophosphohydrolase n=1 Tax=Siminovitchia fortis TaxID=254758 RepID=UPI001642BA9C|nr:nucleoside triphosphate pyrophosphohydrolase [Siminovitchia fortis]